MFGSALDFEPVFEDIVKVCIGSQVTLTNRPVDRW